MQTETSTKKSTAPQFDAAAFSESRTFHRIEIHDLEPAAAQMNIPIVRVSEVWKGVQYSALND